MRYYLDTNALIFIIFREHDNLHHSIREILADYGNTLYVSSVVIKEILFLSRIGKLNLKFYKTEANLIDAINNEFGIRTVLFSENHLKRYSTLGIVDGHKDMNDHAIIAQAMSDKIPLISSDTKFKEYTAQGLNFIYNKR